MFAYYFIVPEGIKSNLSSSFRECMSINPLIDTLNQSSRPSSAFSNFVALRGHMECSGNSATWVGGKKNKSAALLFDVESRILIKSTERKLMKKNDFHYHCFK